MKKQLRWVFIYLFVVAALLALPAIALASHSWGNYHWARTSNPFTLMLGDNVSSAWDPYLATTASDWSKSSVLDTVIVGGRTNPKVCRATSGRVEVCNSKYGNNGWLGIAQIWINGDHIVQGVVKVNDTYFNTAKYNTSAWRNLVMCQEVGHTLGLGHNDEDFSTTNGTCMDYSNNPEPNQHPDTHDYEQLEAIYAHLDTTTTVAPMSAQIRRGDFHNRSEWGQEINNNGNIGLYMRDFGKGQKVFTHVIWAH